MVATVALPLTPPASLPDFAPLPHTRKGARHRCRQAWAHRAWKLKRLCDQVVAFGAHDARLGEFAHLQRLADFFRR